MRRVYAECLTLLLVVVFIGCEQPDSAAQEIDHKDTKDQLPDDPQSLVKLIILSEKTLDALIAEDDELDIFGLYKHVRQVAFKARGHKGFRGVEAYEKLCRSEDEATFRMLETYLNDHRLGVTFSSSDYSTMSWSAFYALRGKLYRANGLKIRRYANHKTRLVSITKVPHLS